MTRLFFLAFLLALTACGKRNPLRTERIRIEGSGKVSVIVMGAATVGKELRKEAEALGVRIEGDSILRLTGEASDISSLNIPAESDLSFITDGILNLERGDFGSLSAEALYQAKKEFGLLEFWKEYPLADGRGVIAGVLDDGISPNQAGFLVTTTGERKFLKKGSSSTFTTYDLTPTEEGFSAQILEGVAFSGKYDLNEDGKFDPWRATVSSDGKLICLDLDVSDSFSENECKGAFSITGEYFTLPSNKTLVIMAEVDLENKRLQLFQPEKDYDSHGEGVASVLAGHRIGNLPGHDGVAPGAKILDYDLSEQTDRPAEKEFTLGTFLLGLEWLGKNGAEVVNISYSLFFTSAQSQTFMAQAIQKLVEKYNMVISFSAGNNGPGLGSLNRRLTYPASVLVVGAHVPKELDESVHGVTGLPKDGRVVFYSSRGPGVNGVGPLLIAPLSSLTNSSSNKGFRAFSGTSSASPALAGAATVLISAIKQKNLKVDAATVVHALRLSGRRIKGEPFISQGYGLPQVGDALRIYESLIRGERFIDVTHTVNRGSLDGTQAQGIFLKRSSSERNESYRITLTGILPALAPADSTTNLLVPVEIHYTKGIKGARDLWVSVSSSQFFVDVDIEELLDSSAEAFGEITLISKTDKSILAVIPVTAVDDLRVGKFHRTSLSVSSEEGARLHLNVPAGVSGLRIRSRITEGEASFLRINAYNPDYVRFKTGTLNHEFLVPTEREGHYQLTLSMAGGSSRKGTVEFELEEVDLRLLTDMAQEDKGIIRIANRMRSALSGELILTPEPTLIRSMILSNKTKGLELTLTLPKKAYKVDLAPTGRYDLSYFYSSCSILEQTEKDGILPTMGKTYYSSGEGEVTLIFRCVPFDFGIDPNEKLLWRMLITSPKAAQRIDFNISGQALREVILPKLTPGKYDVSYRHSNSLDLIRLGELVIE